jgi:hypothetical protein
VELERDYLVHTSRDIASVDAVMLHHHASANLVMLPGNRCTSNGLATSFTGEIDVGTELRFEINFFGNFRRPTLGVGGGHSPIVNSGAVEHFAKDNV